MILRQSFPHAIIPPPLTMKKTFFYQIFAEIKLQKESLIAWRHGLDDLPEHPRVGVVCLVPDVVDQAVPAHVRYIDRAFDAAHQCLKIVTW